MIRWHGSFIEGTAIPFDVVTRLVSTQHIVEEARPRFMELMLEMEEDTSSLSKRGAALLDAVAVCRSEPGGRPHQDDGQQCVQ